jgi:hypothetical protein
MSLCFRGNIELCVKRVEIPLGGPSFATQNRGTENQWHIL